MLLFWRKQKNQNQDKSEVRDNFSTIDIEQKRTTQYRKEGPTLLKVDNEFSTITTI